MLTDCDMLLRYNTWTSQWRERIERQEKEHRNNDPSSTERPNSLLAIMKTDLHKAEQSPPIPRTHINPKITRVKIVNRTLLAETCDRARTIWIIGQGSETATTTMKDLGLEALNLKGTDEQE